MKINNYSAPTYYEKFVTNENENYFQDLKDIEWRGQIQSSAQNKKFRIKYYGDFFEKYGLIVSTDFAPALVVAEDVETGEQILLFDGCQHGYNAMFCDEYSKEQVSNRPLSNTFADKDGNEVFEVLVSVYYNIDYNEELEDFQNEEGEVELISGEIISVETLFRNGFDFIQIQLINPQGESINILEEELA